MSSDGKVIYEVRGDYSKLDGDLNKSHEKVKAVAQKVEKVLSTSAKAIGAAFATSLAAGSAAIVAFGKKGIDLASDLQEVQNVVETTFGDKGAAQIEKFAASAIENFGLSELSAKQMSSTMGAMLKSMGLADKEVLQMSTDLTGLAGDMASFYNLDPTEAFEKLRAGISGEIEPLKQLGINMSAHNLQTFAMEKGYLDAAASSEKLKDAQENLRVKQMKLQELREKDKVSASSLAAAELAVARAKEAVDKAQTVQFSSLDAATQAQIRYEYILATTADAHGDFAKTSDSYANQTRILGEQVNSLAAEMGEILLPAMTKGVTVLRESTVGNEAFREELKGVFEIVAQLAEKALPILLSAFQKIYETTKTLAGAGIPVLVEVFQKVKERVSELAQSVIPALTQTFQALSPLFETLIKHAKGLIDVFLEIVKPIVNAIKEGFSPLMEAIGELYKVVFPMLQSVMDALKPYFVTWGKGVGDTLGSAIKSVISIFTELINFLKNVFTGNWRSAWQNVVNVFSSLWSGIKNSFKIPINSLIDMINQFTSGLSKIQIPDWVPGVGGKGFSIPKIPKLRVGMDFVPSDDFPALLHRGEAVLTASEAAQWRARCSMPAAASTAGGYGGNVSIDYDKLARAMSGMTVVMDKQKVGYILTPEISYNQARQMESYERSGFDGY